jgi:hypothetical protein
MDQDVKLFIAKVANLFPSDVKNMEQLDAADFKDRAGKIWDLVEMARRLQQKD